MQRLDNLSDDDKQLIDAAVSELRAKNSEPLQTVVAAARTKSGKTVSAINLYHFTGGPCAEGVLMANTLFQNDPFETIVAVHFNDEGNEEIINPCGRCRQMFNDYQESVHVIVDSEGDVKVVTVNELLPYSYKNKAIEYTRDKNDRLGDSA